MTYYISNKRLIENNLINISIAAYLKKNRSYKMYRLYNNEISSIFVIVNHLFHSIRLKNKINLFVIDISNFGGLKV